MISVLTDKMEAIGSTKEQAMETLGLSSGGDVGRYFSGGSHVQQVSHIDLLPKKDWYLETRPERPFTCIGDNPVVLKNSNDFGPYGNLGLAVRGIQIYLPLSSTLMLAMYCPSIREQMVRQKQHLQHLLARAPHLIPRHIRPFEDWNISGGIRTIFLCRLPRSMSRITIPCRWSSRSSTCSAVKRISLWLRMLADSERATGLARGLRFSPNRPHLCRKTRCTEEFCRVAPIVKAAVVTGTTAVRRW
uniref:Uncharacterized protein n=1 Tax=Escherichia coli TaxID=562 RepID=A0A8F1LAI5_ECOLX|nr:hypothetical protein IHCLGBEB_00006 [Escherichia coli]